MIALSPSEVAVVRAFTAKAEAGEWSNCTWILRGWKFGLVARQDRRSGRVRWRFEASPFPAVKQVEDVAWRDLGQILAAVGMPILGVPWRVPMKIPFVAEWLVMKD